MLVAEALHGIARNAAFFAVTSAGIAPASAAPGANDSVAIAANLGLTGAAMFLLLAAISSAGMTSAVLGQLEGDVRGLAANGRGFRRQAAKPNGQDQGKDNAQSHLC